MPVPFSADIIIRYVYPAAQAALDGAFHWVTWGAVDASGYADTLADAANDCAAAIAAA